MYSQAYSQADSLAVKQDSTTSYDWTPKGSLNPELQQQRADNRAEVESMKHRFRQFHQQSSEKEQETQKTAEDQNFLWSEAKGSSSNGTPTQTKKKTASATTNTEDMRMQISRSFQQETIVSPTDIPVTEYDFDTNQAVYPKGGQPASEKTEWEKSAFQPEKAPEVDWQLNLDQNRNSPLSSQILKTGEVINMELNFEDRSSVLSSTIKMRLNEWLALFYQHPGIKIEVRAHTHKGVPYTKALELTTQRARAIIDYFSASGIALQQLNFKGYGNLLPLFLPSDENNQQKNERIELIILELPKR